MKKIGCLILLIMGLSSLSNSFGQEVKRPASEYFTMTVEPGVNRNGTFNKLNLDIGEQGRHSLKGVVGNTKVEQLRFTIDGKVTMVANPVDALNIFASMGWEILSINYYEIAGKNVEKYLFRKTLGDMGR